MFELKKLSRSGIEAALTKVERYRLLGEPWEAESICRDVLAVEPDHPQALVLLLLSLTDQFRDELGENVTAARAIVPRLATEYQRCYYAGIISERRGKVGLVRAGPGAGPMVHDWLREAMDWYEKAERLRPPDNDEAILRWNTCARLIMKHPHLRPAEEERAVTMLE